MVDKRILVFLGKCEGWLTAAKGIHWNSSNLSQHNLMDEISSLISDFEDLSAEVAQSIGGSIGFNVLRPVPYKIESVRSFVEDVISSAKSFLSELDGMGTDYVGLKSECETFIASMQRKLYLVDFTLKEDLRERLRSVLSESRPKNLKNVADVEKLSGRRPKAAVRRIGRIERLVRKYGINTRLYEDDNWEAIDEYRKVISSLGCEVSIEPCDGPERSMDSGGSRQFSVSVVFDDGMCIDGYIRCLVSGDGGGYTTDIIMYPTCSTSEPVQSGGVDESFIRRVVSEVISESISDDSGIYGWPAGIDYLMLGWKNDRDCCDLFWEIVKACRKVHDRGVELSVDRLANSSMMRKWQALVCSKFSGDQPGYDRRTTPSMLRRYCADEAISRIDEIV